MLWKTYIVTTSYEDLKLIMKFFKFLIFRSWIFRILLVLILIYKLIFNPYTAQRFSEFFLKKYIQANIEFEFKKFSLFYGIEIQNLKVQNLPQNGNDTIFTASRIALFYNLPWVLLGKIKISEIALEKPKIYLTQKDGIWNFESIISKGEEKKEEQKTPEEVSSNEISLPISIQAYFNLHIDELDFHFTQQEKTIQTKVKLEDINFHTLINTMRFSKIPLNIKAIQILETIDISLNPTQSLKVEYSDENHTISTELIARLILKKIIKENSHLEAELRLSTDSLQIVQAKKSLKSFQFDIGFQCLLEENKDEFECRDFHFIFEKDKWLSIDAKILKLSSPTPDIQVSVSESTIILSDLNPLFKTIPMLSHFQIGGIVSFSGIQSKGDIDNLLFTGKIKGQNLSYKSGNTSHEVPILNLNFDSKLNLSDKSQSTEEDILPILENFQLHDLSLIYNGISISLKGKVIPKNLVDLSLNVKNIYLEKFTNQAYGTMEILTRITGSKLSYLNVDIKGYLQKLRYKMGRGTSGLQNLALHINSTIDLKGGFALEDLQIEPFELTLKNENNLNAIDFTSHVDLDLKKGLSLKISGLKLKGNMTSLLPTVPIGLKNTVSSVRNGLGNELSIKGEFLYEKSNEQDHIEMHVGGSFPALELNDLKIDTELFQYKDKSETLKIPKIQLTAFNKKLKANFVGKFYKPFTPNPPFGDKTGELKGSFTLESETPRYVLKGIQFEGDIDFNINIEGRYVTGEIKSQNSNIQIQSNCLNPPCPRYLIKGLYLNIPLSYDLLNVHYEELIQGNKENFVQNYGFTKPSNFKVYSVEGSHPIHTDKMISYITPTENSPGLTGFIEFKDNFLTIDNLKIYALNGVIFARDILFNLADGSPENMQYAGVLQIRDIDVKPLLDERAQNKIDNGKLRADLNFSGSNLTDPIGNTDLSFSIFQIGSDFGKSAINIVSPTNLITDYIINSYSVNRVEIELTKGLVYTKVKFNKSILNKIALGLENDELKQERVPIASFLNRTKLELENYNQ